ncbi:MAG: 4-oxalocrotonate tautomerase [Promethearchaeia archaeon]|nr:MAG: 4-oxalocrotonate tautomerase [Candidatus Lokiarchaeia archaeon]
MPSIIIEGPILHDLDQKRELVKKITEIAEEIYHVDKSHITITIRGYPPEDVGVGGVLISDLRARRNSS